MNTIQTLIKRYPMLKVCEGEIERTFGILERCFSESGTLYVAGNGGSCADSEHIVGELMKGFRLPRKCPDKFAEKLRQTDPVRGEYLAERLQRGLPAIALDGHQALNTAYLNDVEGGGLLTYAQQLYGYGKEKDVFLAISTSGNSRNILYAAVVARALGMKIIALTGEKGGALAPIADAAVRVPESETYRVQELHLPIYHCLCLMLEERFFGEE